MKEYIITWHIENISYSCHNTGEKLVSPQFFAFHMNNSCWNLHLYPRGETIGDFLSLYLQRNDGRCEHLAVNFELSCISSAGNSLVCMEFYKDFLIGETYGHPRFLRRHDVFFQRKELFLPQNVLSLRCRIWINEGVQQCKLDYGLTSLHMEKLLSIEDIEKTNEKIIYLRSHSKKRMLEVQVVLIGKKLLIKLIPIAGEYLRFTTCKFSLIDKSNMTVIREHFSSWLGPPRKECWRMPITKNGQENESDVKDLQLKTEFVYSRGIGATKLVIDDPYPSRMPESVSNYLNSFTSSGSLSKCPGFVQELHNLYLEQVLCDVELKTSTSSFFVHKYVLCARSNVFLAMLSCDMKEKKRKCIEIEDLSDNVLVLFLLYLYTDSFEDMKWDDVIGLYYVADKYEVIKLKALCCSYLLKKVKLHNVPDLVLLADRHNDSAFKVGILNFIWRKKEEIFRTQEWQDFQRRFNHIADEIMKKLRTANEKCFFVSPGLHGLCSDIVEDFSNACTHKLHADFGIKTKKATIPVHKIVLSASSVTWREFFTKDLEQPTDVLVIPELDDDLVDRFLIFLYTDILKGHLQYDEAIKLYRVADVYQIARLKIKCLHFLLENFKPSHASDLLLLADERGDQKLKTVVEHYICLYDEEIFGSDKWAHFSEANCKLANEAMRSKYRKH